MSWLCDVCGYENEFNDRSQPTACLCCGEPASESKIIEARRELDAHHREEERKARIEELRRKHELYQQKFDHIAARAIRAVKAIPIVSSAMVIIAVVWIAVSFYSEGMTISAWNTQMFSNINAISFTDYPDEFKNRLGDIGLSEKMFAPLEEAGQIVGGQLSARFSAILANIMAKNNISASDFSSNDVELNKPAPVQNNYLGDNALDILENVGSELKQVGKHVPSIIQNIINSSSNMILNLPVFWNNAKDNVEELFKAITIREGGSDD